MTECFRANAEREDQSLYDTMRAIQNRLAFDLVVKHPVTPNETITNGSDEAKARQLRDKLKDALDWLAPTQADDCTRAQALKCWDKVFNTDFFSERAEANAAKSERTSSTGPAILTDWLRQQSDEAAQQGAMRKEGGGRYA